MSYAAEQWARAQTVGNARAKQVLIELAHCLNGKTQQCTPGIAYLRQVTELNEKTITKATDYLQEKGFIRKSYVKTSTGRGISYAICYAGEDAPKTGGMDTSKTGGMGTPKTGLTPNLGVPPNFPEDTTKTGGMGTPKTGLTPNLGVPPNFPEDTTKTGGMGTPKTGGTDTTKFGGETGNKNREIEQEGIAVRENENFSAEKIARPEPDLAEEINSQLRDAVDRDPDDFDPVDATPEALDIFDTEPLSVGGTKAAPCPVTEIVALYNKKLGPYLRTVRKMTPARAQAVRARWRDVAEIVESQDRATVMEGMSDYFDKIARSNFLMGRVPGKAWRADFDFIFSQRGFTRIFEDKYANG